MRYLIDTHIFVWYAKEPENLSLMRHKNITTRQTILSFLMQ